MTIRLVLPASTLLLGSRANIKASTPAAVADCRVEGYFLHQPGKTMRSLFWATVTFSRRQASLLPRLICFCHQFCSGFPAFHPRPTWPNPTILFSSSLLRTLIVHSHTNINSRPRPAQAMQHEEANGTPYKSTTNQNASHRRAENRPGQSWYRGW